MSSNPSERLLQLTGGTDLTKRPSIPDSTKSARAKGGRASGGTRYFHGKSSGEDKMVRLMQKALDEKKEEQDRKISLEDLSVDELIAILELSCVQTERLMREVRKRCFKNKM